MKSNPTITAGLFSCLVLVIIYGYLIAREVSAPVASTSTPAVAIDPSFLNSSVFKSLTQKNKNGTLPVTVTASEVGNSNPFE